MREQHNFTIYMKFGIAYTVSRAGKHHSNKIKQVKYEYNAWVCDIIPVYPVLPD